MRKKDIIFLNKFYTIDLFLEGEKNYCCPISVDLGNRNDRRTINSKVQLATTCTEI